MKQGKKKSKANIKKRRAYIIAGSAVIAFTLNTIHCVNYNPVAVPDDSGLSNKVFTDNEQKADTTYHA